MTEVFGPAYAAAYDALYGDKDYEAECEIVVGLATRYAQGDVHRILDLGAGTGGHVVPLARRGFDLTGVDRAPEMIAIARVKAVAAGVDVRLEVGDIRSVELGVQFDAVLMMFAVLGYLGDDDGVAAGLESARRHLREGGLLIFDVWYEAAVLAERPSERARDVATDEGTIRRRSNGTLDEERQMCTVVFDVTDERNGATTHEEHTMRYFSRDDLVRLCAAAGFELIHLSGFPETERDPDASTWSVGAVARAI